MSWSNFKKRADTHGTIAAIKMSLQKSTGKKRKKAILSLEEAEDRFTKIYETNHWNSLESRSGEGSTLENTVAIRAALPKIFADHSVQTVLDAPCGDFNWMKEVVKETQVSYVGGDIVKPLIEHNNAQFGSERIRFANIDITQDPLPKADLMICRDCLFHLSYLDISKFLENFLSHDIPLLLTTTNVTTKLETVQNSDIETGDMRPIDLFTPPFGVSKANVLAIVEDQMISRESNRNMLLLPKSEVKAMLANLRSR